MSEKRLSDKFDPTAKPLLFTNGVKAYVNSRTNPIILINWLLKQGCRVEEMPDNLRKIARKRLRNQEVEREKRRQKIALAVKLELEGKKPSEVAKALKITPRAYWRFRANNKDAFIAEFDRIASDTRVEAISRFLEVERKLTSTMPKAAGAVDEIIENPETPPGIRSRTALELLKIMRQRTVQDRIKEMDQAFGALAYDTAIGDPVLAEKCDYEVQAEVIESNELPPGDVEQPSDDTDVMPSM